MLGAGVCTINANQAGDSVYFAAPQSSATVTINPADPVSLTAPKDTVVEACAGESVYDMYEDWLSRATYSGGCELEVDLNGAERYINTCGDTIHVIWTAESSCEEIQTTINAFLWWA